MNQCQSVTPPELQSAPTVVVSLQGFEYIEAWLRQSYFAKEDWDRLPQTDRSELHGVANRAQLLSHLVDRKVLTQYQADRIDAGTTHGLILGNYRVLERLGAGGMGVVFLAEHTFLRRRVAIKVMPTRHDGEHNKIMIERFLNEVRLIAQLQHPNIIWALDTGELPSLDGHGPMLYYHVMEYIPGKDLEDHVIDEGRMSIVQACDVIYQIASALVETDKHHLVHRDIKPSNILLTPEGQAKLLDFGLARHLD